MAYHHALAEALHAYIVAAGIGEDGKGVRFRPSKGRRGAALLAQPVAHSDAWRIVRKRTDTVGIAAPIDCHGCRATGITAHLRNGGPPEFAQAMAGHESLSTIKLYDRTKQQPTRDAVERIRL